MFAVKQMCLCLKTCLNKVVKEVLPEKLMKCDLSYSDFAPLTKLSFQNAWPIFYVFRRIKQSESTHTLDKLYQV